jgi:hypothetical protein
MRARRDESEIIAIALIHFLRLYSWQKSTGCMATLLGMSDNPEDAAPLGHTVVFSTTLLAPG